MGQIEKYWKVGEVVHLPRTVAPIYESTTKSYERLVNSRYICIREWAEGQQGILMKVLGKMPREHIMMKGGEPFCKDEKSEDFSTNSYYSYRFPSVEELKEALDIIRGNWELIDAFEKASMHINPNSTFWVRETVSRLMFLKKLQFLYAPTGKLFSADDDTAHYRVTIVHFEKSKIVL